MKTAETLNLIADLEQHPERVQLHCAELEPQIRSLLI